MASLPFSAYGFRRYQIFPIRRDWQQIFHDGATERAAAALVNQTTEEYAPAMSEAPPDFKALARRYLDLWQEQVAAMANDPALAEAVAQGVAMMAQMPAAFLQAAAAGATAPVNQARAADAGKPFASPPDPAAPGESGPPGTSPAAPASDDARFDADGLARRLAAVEERLAALESRLGSAGGSPAPKPKRGRTKRVG
ncbi:MAG: hypothetical protein NVV74_25475 [Magnetospirillum sp.]|nr:hypothetical protein [Magnetospirillum sp.]